MIRDVLLIEGIIKTQILLCCVDDIVLDMLMVYNCVKLSGHFCFVTMLRQTRH